MEFNARTVCNLDGLEYHHVRSLLGNFHVSDFNSYLKISGSFESSCTATHCQHQGSGAIFPDLQSTAAAWLWCQGLSLPHLFSKLMVEVEDESGASQIPNDNLSDLQRAVFILPEELEKEPYLGNAFGRVADLCFFVAKCEDLSSQQHCCIF